MQTAIDMTGHTYGAFSVTKVCNVAKHAMGVTAFREWVKRVHEYWASK